MPRLHVLSIAVALVAATSSASAQYRGGGGNSSSARPAPANEVRQASGGAWNGTASKWGGSPVQSRNDGRNEARGAVAYFGQTGAYTYGAIAASAPVPATNYAADTACAPAAGPVQMQVVTSQHEDHVPTTLEVYRSQPRFQKPR
jgi:hypothetical protein